MDPLQTITELSHKFGTDRYVRGGGGNTSVKDAETLWVKPSGTTLAGLGPEMFVPMDRATLAELYAAAPPEDATAREAMIKDMMAAAVRQGATGRPSVEAPLHDSFDAKYVVHTHPAMVNGMTCAAAGAEACAALFPDALWVEYVDPGYTLCMHVRRELAAYKACHGSQPAAVFLANHGLFVAGDSAEQIDEIYDNIMTRLARQYAEAGITTELTVADTPTDEIVAAVIQRIQSLSGDFQSVHVCASGAFPVAAGPISPDHIVYAKSYPLVGEPTAEAVEAFSRRYGYPPNVIAWDDAVYGLGRTPKAAGLSLELALDGTLVIQLAEAFGGIRYMTDAARAFIENWEVESYRQKQL